MLSVRLAARGIVGVGDMPNRAWSTTEPEAFVWQYTGSNVWFLEDGSVVFAHTSTFSAVTWYDDMTLTGEYCRATVAGEVYDTHRVLDTRACSDTGCVVPVNVVGNARVPFAGPMVPEDGLGAVLCTI